MLFVRNLVQIGLIEKEHIILVCVIIIFHVFVGDTKCACIYEKHDIAHVSLDWACLTVPQSSPRLSKEPTVRQTISHDLRLQALFFLYRYGFKVFLNCKEITFIGMILTCFQTVCLDKNMNKEQRTASVKVSVRSTGFTNLL